MSKNWQEIEKTLKPCPHCGGQAILQRMYNDWWVDCRAECQDASDVQGAANKWNERVHNE